MTILGRSCSSFVQFESSIASKHVSRIDKNLQEFLVHIILMLDTFPNYTTLLYVPIPAVLYCITEALLEFKERLLLRPHPKSAHPEILPDEKYHLSLAVDCRDLSH